MYAKNADFTAADNQAVVEANGLITNGQMWIGSTATNVGGTHINVGSITSSTLTIGYSSPNITINVPGGAAITSVVTANATPQFVLSGTVETLDFGTSTNLVLGSSLPVLTTGVSNTGLGLNSLITLTSGQGNTAIGAGCMDSVITGLRNTGVGAGAGTAITSGGDNTAIGESALKSLATNQLCTAVGSSALANCTADGITAVGQAALANITTGIEAAAFGYRALALATGSGNTAMGYASMFQVTTGPNNTAYGKGSGANFLTGSTNLLLGYNVGNNYVGAESSNILLQNLGTAAESNVIRIGTQGTSAGQQNKAFMAGITGATPTGGNAPQVVLCDNAGQLTPISSSTSGFVLTSNGSGTTPTFQAAGGGGSSVYFSAYLSAPTANVTGDGTNVGPIVFNTALANVGGGYNTATGVFTAPSTGFYAFQESIAYNGADATVSQYIAYFTGSVYESRSFQLQPLAGGGTFVLSASIAIQMTAGDTMTVHALASGSASKGVQIYGAAPGGGAVVSIFSGYKVA